MMIHSSSRCSLFVCIRVSVPTGECILNVFASFCVALDGSLSTSSSALHTVLNTTILNQELWGEIGQGEMERDRMILQLEEDCLNVYRQKVNQTRKQKADLLQELSFGEADMDKILYTLYGPDL